MIRGLKVSLEDEDEEKILLHWRVVARVKKDSKRENRPSVTSSEELESNDSEYTPPL